METKMQMISMEIEKLRLELELHKLKNQRKTIESQKVPKEVQP